MEINLFWRVTQANSKGSSIKDMELGNPRARKEAA